MTLKEPTAIGRASSPDGGNRVHITPVPMAASSRNDRNAAWRLIVSGLHLLLKLKGTAARPIIRVIVTRKSPPPMANLVASDDLAK
jgi:hypothetical protein